MNGSAVLRYAMATLALLMAFALPAACSAQPPFNEDITYQLESGQGQCGATAIGPHTLITANHCVEGDVRAVSIDGKTAMAVVSITRDGSDHALIRVDGDLKRWARIGLAPRIGEWIYFRGSPHGFGLLLHFGRVAGVGHLPKEAHVDPVLAKRFTLYDVQVAPGDSGSGIFNRRGELVGIVSIMTAQNTYPANFMGSLPLAFSAAEWEQAGK